MQETGKPTLVKTLKYIEPQMLFKASLEKYQFTELITSTGIGSKKRS